MDQVGRDRPVIDAQHHADGLWVSSEQVARGKGEVAKREIGKHLVGQQGGVLGDAAGAAAGTGRPPTESALPAGKPRGRPGKSVKMAVVTAHPEKAVPDGRTSDRPRISGEHGRAGICPAGQLVHKGRVVRFDELVMQCLVSLMALVDGFAKAMPMTRGAGSPCLVPTGWFRLGDRLTVPGSLAMLEFHRFALGTSRPITNPN